MKKDPLDTTNWRAKYDALLLLLWKVRSDPRSGFHDLCLRNDSAEKVRGVLDASKRYDWKKVGQARHLFPAHDARGDSVGFVIKLGKGRYEWKLTGRGFRAETGVEKNFEEARTKVEHHFVLLERE